MKILNFSEVEAKEAAPGFLGRVVIGENQGAPHFEMRVLEIQSGNYTPFHSHGWEHETFVLSGQGVVKGEYEEKAIRNGSVILIEPNEKHSFTNSSGEVLRLIDVIPTPKTSSYTEETNARKRELEHILSKFRVLAEKSVTEAINTMPLDSLRKALMLILTYSRMLLSSMHR